MTRNTSHSDDSADTTNPYSIFTTDILEDMRESLSETGEKGAMYTAIQNEIKTRQDDSDDDEDGEKSLVTDVGRSEYSGKPDAEIMDQIVNDITPHPDDVDRWSAPRLSESGDEAKKALENYLNQDEIETELALVAEAAEESPGTVEQVKACAYNSNLPFLTDEIEIRYGVYIGRTDGDDDRWRINVLGDNGREKLDLLLDVGEWDVIEKNW